MSDGTLRELPNIMNIASTVKQAASYSMSILLTAAPILGFSSAALSATELKLVSSVQKLKFDTPAWNADLGRTTEMEIDVPKNAISVSIFASSDSLEDYYVVDSVIDPTGKFFVSPTPLSQSLPPGVQNGFGVGPMYSPNRSMMGQSPGYVGLVVPNNPALSMTEGKWKFTVAGLHNDGKPSLVAPSILVVVKSKNDGAITQKTRAKVNMHFQFTGSDNLSAANFFDNRFNFQKQIENFKSIYSAIGLEFNLIDATDTNLTQNSIDIDTVQTMQLFKRGSGDNGVNFIFVPKIVVGISLGSEQTAQGYSGALVGPQFMPGAPLNGVLVITATSHALAGLPPISIVMAHEAAHFLGVPHILDNPQVKDAFGDTPELHRSTNLMSNDPNENSINLSVQQRHQLFLNPAVMLFEEQP